MKQTATVIIRNDGRGLGEAGEGLEREKYEKGGRGKTEEKEKKYLL